MNVDKSKLLVSPPRKKPRKIDRQDNQILLAVRKIIHAYDVNSKRLVREHNITGPQLMTLHAIIDNEPVTATEIGRQLYLSTATLVGIIDRLAQRGFIVRNRDGKDRRFVYITATKAGRRFASRTPDPLIYSIGRAVGELPDEKKRIFATAIQQIIETIDI